MPTTAASPVPRFNPWPYAIIGFFVVAIGATCALIGLAQANRTELVAADYYDQEMRYQQRIEQVRRTQVWESQITVVLDADRNLHLSLPAAHAAAGARGQVEFYRPSAAAADQSVPLALDASGSQRIPAAHLAAGRWRVRLRWGVADETFYAERDLMIPGVDPQ